MPGRIIGSGSSACLRVSHQPHTVGQTGYTAVQNQVRYASDKILSGGSRSACTPLALPLPLPHLLVLPQSQLIFPLHSRSHSHVPATAQT